MTRPLPVDDQLSVPFWEAARNNTLAVERCARCHRYQFPAKGLCGSCLGAELTFEPVSGKGTVESYSVTVSGARHPYFAEQTPYVVGVVELQEQQGLLMHANIATTEGTAIRCGAPVCVYFEDIGDGFMIPQFRVVPSLGDALEAANE
jgi:uncharacterized OB-fold protein